MVFELFAILQMYDFSSKSQPDEDAGTAVSGCLRYCKCTIFQANHNRQQHAYVIFALFAILQMYDFSSKSQPPYRLGPQHTELFAILQMYDFSSKSQHGNVTPFRIAGCLRYCKCTIFQANHNRKTTHVFFLWLFAILQMYDFSSKSQQTRNYHYQELSCLRYCKCTIFQANHNFHFLDVLIQYVVCGTANVRFFKQITTTKTVLMPNKWLFAVLQMYDFSSKSQPLQNLN